jgi:PAS domain S-box-containing protein
MPWLQEADCALLKSWLQNTSVPSITSAVDGRIYWCNKAFEEMIGYSEFELTLGQGGRGISWYQLSVSDDSLEADKKMTEELMAGRRVEYTCRKRYIPKNQSPIWVELHVMRWPREGTDVHCFLVIILPLHQETNYSTQIIMDQIKLLRENQEIILKESTRGNIETLAISLARIINANPKPAAMVFLFILAMLLGSELLRAVETIKKLSGFSVPAVKEP